MSKQDKNKPSFSKFGKDFQESLCQLILVDRPFADQIMEVLDESALPGVEKRCVILRYGLIDNKERSLAEVAELMCMSIEGVRTHLQAAHERVAASPSAQGIMRTESVRSHEHVGLGMLRHARAY